LQYRTFDEKIAWFNKLFDNPQYNYFTCKEVYSSVVKLTSFSGALKMAVNPEESYGCLSKLFYASVKAGLDKEQVTNSIEKLREFADNLNKRTLEESYGYFQHILDTAVKAGLDKEDTVKRIGKSNKLIMKKIENGEVEINNVILKYIPELAYENGEQLDNYNHEQEVQGLGKDH
jgi:hypothetical protein